MRRKQQVPEQPPAQANKPSHVLDDDQLRNVRGGNNAGLGGKIRPAT